MWEDRYLIQSDVVAGGASGALVRLFCLRPSAAGGLLEDCSLVVHGYRPYVFVKLPLGCTRAAFEAGVLPHLEVAMRQPLAVEWQPGKLIDKYRKLPDDFAKIYVKLPQHVRTLTSLLQHPRGRPESADAYGLSAWLPVARTAKLFCTSPWDVEHGPRRLGFELAEAGNVDHVMRFGADTDAFGMRPFGWFRVSTDRLREATRETAVTSDPLSEQHATWAETGLFAACEETAHLPNPERALRILSFDIEVNPECEDGVRRGFPKAATSKVLTIAAVTGGMFDCSVDRGAGSFKEDAMQRRAWQLGQVHDATALLDHAGKDINVSCCESEADVLLGFAAFVKDYSPHLITGWKAHGFDWPFLEERAGVLRVESEFCAAVSRSAAGGEHLALRTVEFKTKAVGRIKRYLVSIPGRVHFDMLAWFLVEKSEGSYKLGVVASSHLGQTKEEMPYSQIAGAQRTAEGRARLVQYCVWDAVLPFALGCLHKAFLRWTRLANVCGLELPVFFEKGQQVRFLSLLLRYSRRCQHRDATPWRFLVCTLPSTFGADAGSPEEVGLAEGGDGDGVDQGKGATNYQGAKVLDCVIGRHACVSTLDFASLYPSIIRANNVCPTTFVEDGVTGLRRDFPELAAGLVHQRQTTAARDCGDALAMRIGLADESDASRVLESDGDPCFVTPNVHAGLVPEILTDLLAQRKDAKRLMKEAAARGDASEAAAFDAMQLGLKVCANGMYGGMGGISTFVQNKHIAAAVTRDGRCLIQLTKQVVEAGFVVVRAPGVSPRVVPATDESVAASADVEALRVIYGDTDSVFVNFPDDVAQEEVFRASEEMSAHVTALLAKPHVLEFEKIYRPFVQWAKKTYAGVKYAADNADEGSLSFTGISAVRRDGFRFLSDAVKEALRMMLVENASEPALVDWARERVRKLRDREVERLDFQSLSSSKGISKPLDEYATVPAHVRAALRINEANHDGEQIGAGTRFDTVVVEGKTKASVGDRTRGCAAAWLRGEKLDVEYYIDQTVNKLTHYLAPAFAAREQEIVAKSQLSFGQSSQGAYRAALNRNVVHSNVKKNALPGQALVRKRILELSRKRAAASRHDSEGDTAQLARLREVLTECHACLKTDYGGDIEDVGCENTDCRTYYQRKGALRALSECRSGPASNKDAKKQNVGTHPAFAKLFRK